MSRGRLRQPIAALLLVMALCLPLLPAEAQIVRDKLLDSALSMLEEDNPFLLRFNDLSGTRLEARYPLGCPYFFGGRIARAILAPSYVWQDSGHFKTGRCYIYGLDCSGFVAWVYEDNGLPKPPRISEMLASPPDDPRRVEFQGLHFDQWPQALEPGDLLAIRGGYNHVMLYIGTLRGYGYTSEDLEPALRPYLDYPLFIHSGENHGYVDRYTHHIASLEADYKIYNTDGGVAVAILGTPDDAAPYTATLERGIQLRYFRLGTYDLIAYSLEGKQAYCGYRRP